MATKKKVVGQSEAMMILASQLDRKKKKFFSIERVVKAMTTVIWESGKGEGKAAPYIRTHTAAKLAVYMQDEYKTARKEHAREGYLMMLERLELVACEKVFEFDPDGSYLTSTFPKLAARIVTPDAVYDAQAEIEVSEAPLKRAEKAKAEKANSRKAA